MNKIIQIALSITLCLCVGLAFAGCSEKERKTADINAEYTKLLKDYASYFDKDTKEFKVEYSDDVTKLIVDDSRASLLTSYFEPVTKTAFSFFVQTNGTIGDKNWSAKSRTAIYNNLSKTRKALQDFDNAKKRFQSALAGHPSGQQMNTIELVDYASFVKAYTDFINVVIKFSDTTVKAFFNDFYTDFYSYDGKDARESYDLQILLKHKAFEIAKASVAFEYGKYFDLETGKFDAKVFAGSTTKLCVEMNKVNALLTKANAKLSDTTKLANYKTLTDKQTFFEAQIDIFNTALKSFDFKKMNKSDETEETYVEKASIAQQKYYQDIFRITYDYIPQVVADYSTVFVSF